MRLLVLLSVLLVGTTVLKANSVRMDCDTLVTHAGSILVVQIESVKQGTIRYYDCGTSKRLERMDFREIREIRRARDTKSGTDLVKDAALLAEEERKLNNSSKLAALFGAGSLFLWLFALAFSPWVGIFILPCTILALVYGSRVLRKTRNRPEYRSQRSMGRFGLITAGSQLAFGVVYFLFALLLLVFWGWW